MASLRFIGAGSDRVSVADVAMLQDLATWSVVMRIKRGAGAGGTSLIGKGRAATNTRRLYLQLQGAVSITVQADRATADLNYLASVVATDPIISASWQWVAATMNNGGVAGDLVRFYVTQPDLTELRRVTPSTATDGSGAFQSDVGQNLNIGNATDAASNAFGGYIKETALFNREMSLTELQQVVRMLLAKEPPPGALGVWFLGDTGAVSVPDASGNRNTGTVSGATMSGEEPPFMFTPPPVIQGYGYPC